MALPGRTTVDLVKGIVEVDDDTWPDITPFIDLANELTTEICVDRPAEANDTHPYNAHRLELIERYLSAHFYRAGPDPAVSSERAAVVSESLQHKIGFGLKNTAYGQQALRLDTKGGLASLDNATEKVLLPKGGVGVTYLGRSCRTWPRGT